MKKKNCEDQNQRPNQIKRETSIFERRLTRVSHKMIKYNNAAENLTNHEWGASSVLQEFVASGFGSRDQFPEDAWLPCTNISGRKKLSLLLKFQAHIQKKFVTIKNNSFNFNLLLSAMERSKIMTKWQNPVFGKPTANNNRNFCGVFCATLLTWRKRVRSTLKLLNHLLSANWCWKQVNWWGSWNRNTVAVCRNVETRRKLLQNNKSNHAM